MIRILQMLQAEKGLEERLFKVQTCAEPSLMIFFALFSRMKLSAWAFFSINLTQSSLLQFRKSMYLVNLNVYPLQVTLSIDTQFTEKLPKMLPSQSRSNYQFSSSFRSILTFWCRWMTESQVSLHTWKKLTLHFRYIFCNTFLSAINVIRNPIGLILREITR